MSETADTNDTNAGGWSDVVGLEDVEDGCAATLQWCGVGVTEVLRQAVEELLAPDRVRCHAALILVRVAVHGTLGAVRLAAGEAEVALAAGRVLVAETDAVAFLERFGSGAGALDDAGTFVAEDHVFVAVVFVCAAEAGASYADEDLVVCEVGLCSC